MRWSQLRKRLKDVFDPAIELDVQSTVQRASNGGGIGRYWFTMDGVTLWDEPRNVSLMVRSGVENDDAATMTGIMRRYLDISREALLTEQFPEDRWGLVEILRASDRRIGKRRLHALKSHTQSRAALIVIEKRLSSPGE